MALALESKMGLQSDMMDIDIDMDIDDVGPLGGDEMIEEGEDTSLQSHRQDVTGLIPEIYNEDPALEPQWQKIHLRGVDDMHTNDIQAFAKDHFPHADPHVQWIDDVSCNLVFADKETARHAIIAFTQDSISQETILNDPFTLRSAKPLSSRPTSILTVRVAQAGDRKRKNAREASRWYLLHPEDDPGEKTRREFANSRPGRGEPGDYKRRRYDDREHRRRRDKDHNPEGEDFSANMYDDAPSTEVEPNTDRGRDLFSRVSKGRQRSASPGGLSDSASDEGRHRRRGGKGYRDRSSPPPYSARDPNPHPRKNIGKELFSSDKTSSRSSGTLQSDLFPSSTTQTGVLSHSDSGSSNRPTLSILSPDHRQSNIAAARRLKADLLASTSPSNAYSHPQSPRNGHRRSHAMDAKNEEDLVERFGRKSISADSTKAVTAKTHNSGIELFPSNLSSGVGGLNIKGSALHGGGGDVFSIKGNANANATGLNIRGRAGADQVKELFPEQYSRGNSGAGGGGGGSGSNGNNRGKELFDQPVRERGRRQRAGDLFD